MNNGKPVLTVFVLKQYKEVSCNIVLLTLKVFNTLHTVCFMDGPIIYEIKKKFHRSQFNLKWKFSAFDLFSEQM